jgi:hypothetical protein
MRLEALDERHEEQSNPDWGTFKTFLRCLVKAHEIEEHRQTMIPKIKKMIQPKA